MSTEATSKMLLGAAIWNWIGALGLFFIPELFLQAFFVTPAPEQSIWVQQFAGLVFVFGIGYYWASRDFDNNRAIVQLAVWGKWGAVLIAALNILSGDISWQLMIAASVDGVFAILFTLALKPISR
jgi:hypothetical protein